MHNSVLRIAFVLNALCFILMKLAVVVGVLISAVSIGFAVCDILWFFGYLPVSTELAV